MKLSNFAEERVLSVRETLNNFLDGLSRRSEFDKSNFINIKTVSDDEIKEGQGRHVPSLLKEFINNFNPKHKKPELVYEQ